MRQVNALLGWGWLRIIGWKLKRALVRARSEEGPGDPRRRLYVFGDSLSDTGNVHRMIGWLRAASPTPSPPYHRGRFSDGPNWIDRLAAGLDFVSVAAWDGGSNFAHGGAQAGFGVSSLVSWVPNIGQQIEFFAKMHRALHPRSWIVVCGGHNNLLANVHGKEAMEWDVVVELLIAHLERLYDLGGRKFIVPTLLPLHRAPEAPSDQRSSMRQWLDDFHEEFAIRINAFRNIHEEACVLSPDLNRVASDLLDRPAWHGISNTTTICYDAASGLIAGDRLASFWWDECHPTTLVQEHFAKCALDEVMRVVRPRPFGAQDIWPTAQTADAGLSAISDQLSAASGSVCDLGAGANGF